MSKHAFCPDCSYWLRIRNDGKFPKHSRCNATVPANQRGNICAGSLKKAPHNGGKKHEG